MQTVEQQFERFRQQADSEALAEVFDAVGSELLLIAGHVAAGSAEDLVQATFLDAIEQRDRWDGSRPLRPWLIGILVNHARAGRRAAARRIDPERLSRSSEPSPLEALASDEFREQFATAMESLPQPMRVALTMRLVHGMSPTTIAHTLGCPIATVKTRLQRGREWLRNALPAGVALGAANALLTDTSLAAARAVVVQRAGEITIATAAAGTASATTGTVLFGGLIMKKVLIGGVALSGLLAAFWLWRGAAEPEAAVPSSTTDVTASSPDGNSPALNVDRIDDLTASAPLRREPGANSPTTVRGTAQLEFVWRGDETPVAGLQVHVHPANGDAVRDATLIRTNRQGRVTVTDLTPGDYTVYGHHVLHNFAVAAGEPETERVVVKPFVSFRGRVVDEHGTGIAGAAICWDHLGTDAELPEVVATTDREGNFRGHLWNGGELWARHRRFVRSNTQRLLPGDDEEIRIELREHDATLHGTVYRADRRPAADTLVALLEVGPKNRGGPIAVRTNARGQFSCDELPTGRLLLIARADGHAPTPFEFTLAPGEDRQLDIELDRGGSVFGHVLSSAPARNGGLVTAWPTWIAEVHFAARFGQARTTTAADGAYRLDHVPAGRVRLRASAVHGDAEVTLGAGDESRVDLGAAATGAIHGRLVDGDGQPINGWWALAYSEDTGKGQRAQMGRDGEFTIPDLLPGTYRVAAMPTSMSSGEPWIERTGVRPGPGELELVVACRPEDGAFVHGIALDATGRPAERVAVSWRTTTPGVAPAAWRSSHPEVDQNGRFEVGPLPPGDYELGIHVQGTGHQQLGNRRLARRERLDLGTIRMPGKGRIHVQFARPDGTVVLPAQLSASDRAGNFTRDFEQADGWLTAEVLAGHYTIKAWGADYAPCRQELTVTANAEARQRFLVTAAPTVTFEFTQIGAATDEHWTAGIVLKIATATGEPVQSRWISIDSRGAFPWRRGLLPGNYEYAVEDMQRGEIATGKFSVAGNGPTRIAIELPSNR
ncbi:MAG: sigma-70 family RNA polymerase sigma factor [bacterium]|nr:sigma-70 family RNA polymerase sigma factor [bacterium]